MLSSSSLPDPGENQIDVQIDQSTTLTSEISDNASTTKQISKTYDLDFGRKAVIVGDGGCGKTAMLMVYSGQSFPEEHTPTIFENFITYIPLKNKHRVQLSLWDTAGQEDYDRLRPLSYPDSDVVILCFSVDSRLSFWHIEDKWIPEINHFLLDIPIILVACKTDLRNDTKTLESLAKHNLTIVTEEEGKQVHNNIKSKYYFECSAMLNQGLPEIFNAAGKLASKSRRTSVRVNSKTKKNCKLM
ncbi:GTP-binding protein Rho1 [Nowakowskiella sp. JEL0407]|nr:GTP-binding protein Rho1 [Nowakowskiella sp. JEL0407]